LVEQKTKLEYQQGFRNLSMELSYLNSYQDWAEYYKKILAWEIKFDKVFDNEFADLLQSQKKKPTFNFLNLLKKITNIGSILQKNQSCLIPLSKKK
jgi:hypothetical protein